MSNIPLIDTHAHLDLIQNPTAVTLVGVRAYSANQFTPLKVILFSLMGLIVAGIGVDWLWLNRFWQHKKQM